METLYFVLRRSLDDYVAIDRYGEGTVYDMDGNFRYTCGKPWNLTALIQNTKPVDRGLHIERFI